MTLNSPRTWSWYFELLLKSKWIFKYVVERKYEKWFYHENAIFYQKISEESYEGFVSFVQNSFCKVFDQDRSVVFWSDLKTCFPSGFFIGLWNGNIGSQFFKNFQYNITGLYSEKRFEIHSKYLMVKMQLNLTGKNFSGYQ